MAGIWGLLSRSHRWAVNRADAQNLVRVGTLSVKPGKAGFSGWQIDAELVSAGADSFRMRGVRLSGAGRIAVLAVARCDVAADLAKGSICWVRRSRDPGWQVADDAGMDLRRVPGTLPSGARDFST